MLRFKFIMFALLATGAIVWADRLRCERPDYISNGSYRLKRNFMRVLCDTGYQLQGLKTIGCVRGKWDGERPVCAKKGCPKIDEVSSNGRIQIESGLKATLYCSDNYGLAGNRHTYCNGTHWDRPIGSCRKRTEKVSHQCDFETDDACGWSYEPRANLEWKRVMAANVFTSFKTGPRRDHTTLTHNGGHYMLMESLVRQYIPVPLISPIYDMELSLKTACCFQFYYFMYGAGIGDLLVVVKPLSVTLDSILRNRQEFIKFEKNGNQNNNWNEAHFSIDELEEDFQIVFVAKGGRNQLSDIAIDDVRLLTGKECTNLDATTDDSLSEEEYESSTYQSLFKIQSCVGRCNNSSGRGVIRNEGHLMGLCSCDIDCEEADTCCPDFKNVCVSDLFDTSTVEDTTYPQETVSWSEIISSSEIPTVATPKAINLTTKMTTTTTPKATKATNTTTTTSTPTPKPTTTSTATTTPKATKTTTKYINTSTTTTPKLTTTTSSTTTTTRKPLPVIITTPTTGKSTMTSTKMPTTTTSTTTSTTTTTRKPTTTSTHKPTTPTTTTSTQKPTTTTTPKATSKITTTKRATTTSTTTPSIITTTEHKNSQKIIAVETETQKPSNGSKKEFHIMDTKPKVEAGHKGSSLLTSLLIVILLTVVMAAAYRRYGDKAVAWYMIHFRKHNVGEEDSSSISASFRHQTTKFENNEGPRKTKLMKRPLIFNDMRRPLVEDDEDDDDNVGVNGNTALKINFTLNCSIFEFVTT